MRHRMAVGLAAALTTGMLSVLVPAPATAWPGPIDWTFPSVPWFPSAPTTPTPTPTPEPVSSSGLSSAADAALDLPLTNRDASVGTGGVNPALPTDSATLGPLLDEVRAAGIAPTRYAALLYQYWLARSTEAAGIKLARWNPHTTVRANRSNLVKSYRYYEDFQLEHRELQWAGMAGQVGADFGGGLEDFELATNLLDWSRLSTLVNRLVKKVAAAAGQDAVDQLPEGLPAVVNGFKTIRPADFRWFLSQVLIMQKNIFGDLMPLHTAYVADGGTLTSVEEMIDAGLYDDVDTFAGTGTDEDEDGNGVHDMLDTWRVIATGWDGISAAEAGPIAAANKELLRREQYDVINTQWDGARAYKGDIGEGLTYLMTIIAHPSIAGVLPPREANPVVVEKKRADGRTVVVTLPLPDWNWSVFDERWSWIEAQLLPKYADMVINDWEALEEILVRPYDYQLESGRPLLNLPKILLSMIRTLDVKVVD
ncbi:hypothetical protein [Nocardioides sp. YIM 152588]|uniref:hypothetical protein n=1 Tax=Nocardioides sp. YIM 152588 TaxID=3158259 RepID=UPI0032E43ED2